MGRASDAAHSGQSFVSRLRPVHAYEFWPVKAGVLITNAAMGTRRSAVHRAGIGLPTAQFLYIQETESLRTMDAPRAIEQPLRRPDNLSAAQRPAQSYADPHKDAGRSAARFRLEQQYEPASAVLVRA